MFDVATSKKSQIFQKSTWQVLHFGPSPLPMGQPWATGLPDLAKPMSVSLMCPPSVRSRFSGFKSWRFGDPKRWENLNHGWLHCDSESNIGVSSWLVQRFRSRSEMIWVVCQALGWFRSYPDSSSDPDHPPIDSHASSPGRWFVAREDVQRHRSHRHYSTCPVNWYQLIVILLTSWDKKRTTRYPRWLSGPLRLRNSLACSASPSHGSPSWIVLWDFCGRPWNFLFLSAQRHPAAYGCRKCKVFPRKLSQIVYLHIQMRWFQMISVLL